jgi:hypothetical protein
MVIAKGHDRKARIIMPETYLSRKQFREAVAAGHIPDYPSLQVYPVSTRDAAHELRLRGLDVNHHQLKRMAELGAVNPKGGGGKGYVYLWRKGDIDIAARKLATSKKLTDDAVAAGVMGQPFAEFIGQRFNEIK